MTDELALGKMVLTFLIFLIVTLLILNTDMSKHLIIGVYGLLTMFFIRIVNTNLNL